MERSNRRTTTYLFLVCSLLSLTLLYAVQAQAEGSVGKFVFEYCHSSYGSSESLQTYDGSFIDNEGIVWSYDHGGYGWSPKGIDGLFYEYELSDKYRNLKQVGVVDRSVLSAMASLIESASRGEMTIAGRRVEGMDGMSYRAYLHDPLQDTYKEVILAVRGNGAMRNSSSAAKTLVPWMESVLSHNKSIPPSEPESPEIQRSGQETVKPQLRVIQKIPKPKPEIKAVEIKGPFPIEEQSK